MSAPAIILRPVVDTDSDVLFEWINNRDLVVFSAPYRLIGKEEHKAWFEDIRKKEDIRFFMIEHAETAEAVGSCQLLKIDLVSREAELQIRIGRKEFQNSGAGSEAVRQLVRFGFNNLNLHRISLHVFTTNRRAIRVYEKNGFVAEKIDLKSVCIEGEWKDILFMAKRRSEDA
ncbi:MAG TPA: GNAT family N-acetyltransferase [Polaromonas sp.]|uniref:GNAT family N-acetyltransferase n=1 Tax=Polaromonas sp. TaxID=1869339 RepID=UPI002D38A512|nr:GNAT family N-acetyltransferase [Polaromonas sp.]HYW56849.1 GNAT family N-acetyltransferase [Polaromonas sp.]